MDMFMDIYVMAIIKNGLKDIIIHVEMLIIIEQMN